MSHRLLPVFVACLAGAPLACGGNATLPPDNNTTEVEVIRPTAVETLALAAEEHALPASLQNDATLTVAVLDGAGVLVGGASGLFVLDSSGFTSIDASPVHALATSGTRIIVAADRGLLAWSGTLADSPLSAQLGGETVRALAIKGDDLYFSTASALWLFTGGELWAFSELAGATPLFASTGADDVIAGMSALKKEGTQWSVRALAEEIGASRAVPGSEGRIVALDAGALKQRVPAGEDTVAWAPIALSTEESDPGASGVESISVDPVTGAVWAIDSAAIVRIDRARIGKIDKPAGMLAVQTISVTVDGAVWISDGTTLRRFGNEGRPVTWDDDIATFSQMNCERCHAPLKIAHPLNGYELWVTDIDRIIPDLETMKMPQDQAPLVGGTVDLIRRWRDEGLRR